MSSEQKNISSAEMTAVYRCDIPVISNDHLSACLASPEGIEKARAFIKQYDYPLISRKFSVRAGYFLREANRLLASNHYDSVISFASGFSLLLYHIADNNRDNPAISYYDSDLADIINKRHRRIKAADILNKQLVANIHTSVLDLEAAASSKQKLKQLFPDCQRPIFIIEGITYFLSSHCVNWLIEEIADYSQVGMIVDYWPQNMLEISKKFRDLVKIMNKVLPEQTKSIFKQNTMEKLQKSFTKITDLSIAQADAQLSKLCQSTPQLVDPNEYFPIRFITAENGLESAEIELTVDREERQVPD